MKMFGQEPNNQDSETPSPDSDIDGEIRRVDLASQIAQLEAYRAELISEQERVEKLIAFFREKLREVMQHGTYTIGPSDDEFQRERERTERKRAVWGNVRDVSDRVIP